MYKRIKAYQQGELPNRMAPAPNKSYIGMTIEQRVELIMHNGEPITDGAPQIYTERAEGIKPEYNIRTDRFEQAIEMTDQINKNAQEARKKRQEGQKTDKNPGTTTKTPADPGKKTE
nr:MAG: hypothetical protein [Microviridae sp.]